MAELTRSQTGANPTAQLQEDAMPEGLPWGSFPILASDRTHGWACALTLPRVRFGLARLVCVCGLLALLVSAISPADDLVQADFSRHTRNCHRIVTASKLLQTGHLLRRNWAAAAIAFGAHAGPVRHPADDPVHGLPARLSSPGFERSLAARAPPARSFCNAWRLNSLASPKSIPVEIRDGNAAPPRQAGYERISESPNQVALELARATSGLRGYSWQET